MSKSILLIDTPENCRDCPCGKEIYNHYCVRYECSVISQNITKEEYKKEKPDWCPLKEIPKKKKPRKIHDNNLGHFHVSAFDKGYNKCIDEILQ